MPELVEVEYYRRLAEGARGRTVERVTRADVRAVRGTGAPALRRALAGRRVRAARRRGKLLLLDTDGPTLGMRFGMTGALLLDGRPGVDRLEYGAAAYGRRWVRFELRFVDGGHLALHDPRRFGLVLLDPDESLLGPDALTVTVGELRGALAARGSGPALKARLQDQRRLAGLGNLLTDEVLYAAGLAPWRPCSSLAPDELVRLQRQIRATLRRLLERGGSHTGELMAERRPGGHCPRDGTELSRQTVGGRTTYWCPAHQR